MSLKPTKSESGVFKGCLMTAIIGMIIGGLAGYLYFSSTKEDLAGAQSLFIGLAVLIGSVGGGLVGSLLGAVISALGAKKEKEEEEF